MRQLILALLLTTLLFSCNDKKDEKKEPKNIKILAAIAVGDKWEWSNGYVYAETGYFTDSTKKQKWDTVYYVLERMPVGIMGKDNQPLKDTTTGKYLVDTVSRKTPIDKARVNWRVQWVDMDSIMKSKPKN